VSTSSGRTSSPDLARVTLSVLAIGLLVVACLWILKPFIAAIVWATMVVVATWPTLLALQARLGGRRWLAIVIMTLAMLFVLVLPLALAAAAIFQHAGDLSERIRTVMTAPLPPPPAWLDDVPAVGQRLTSEWRQLAGSSHDELARLAAPYAVMAAQWVAGQIGSLGLLLVQFLLTLVITMLLYSTGEDAAMGVRRFARRLAADRGEQSVVLAGQAIRAVALGIVVTALVQSIVAGIGLAVVGVPYAAALTSIVFMVCLMQIGAFIVLLPAAAWLYWSGHAVAAGRICRCPSSSPARSAAS
jgi:predicted PurR-regulated permease PerM